MMRRLGVFVAGGLLALAAPAAADPITAADVIRVHFPTAGAFPPAVSELGFGVGFMTFLESRDAIQATLFLNGTLTGTSTITLDPQFLHEVIVDLGKLSRGPVTGVDLLRLIGGAVDFDFQQFSVFVSVRLSGGFGGSFPPLPITPIEVNPQPSPTPEPATLILVGTGVAAALCHRRRRFPA